MANADIENRYTDKRVVQGSNTKPGTIGGANYRDVLAMRTRLAAAAPTTYTSAQLDLMTKNDMEYALRTIDDAAGIR